MATWVVTGANRGIGLEFAKQLLAEGHSVIAGVRSPASMKFSHEKMSIFQLDVSSTSSVYEFAENVKSMSQSIDILVNNAGRMDGRWQSLEDVDPEISLDELQHHRSTACFASALATPPSVKSREDCKHFQPHGID